MVTPLAICINESRVAPAPDGLDEISTGSVPGALTNGCAPAHFAGGLGRRTQRKPRAGVRCVGGASPRTKACIQVQLMSKSQLQVVLRFAIGMNALATLRGFHCPLEGQCARASQIVVCCKQSRCRTILLEHIASPLVQEPPAKPT